MSKQEMTQGVFYLSDLVLKIGEKAKNRIKEKGRDIYIVTAMLGSG